MSIIKGLIKKSDYVSVQWNKVWYKKESKNVCVDMELSPRYVVKVKKKPYAKQCVNYATILYFGVERNPNIWYVHTHAYIHTFAYVCTKYLWVDKQETPNFVLVLEMTEAK